MKVYLSTLIMVAYGLIAYAQASYPASAIPAELLTHADAVVRKYELNFTVLNKGEALETEHMVVTLLNSDAAHLGEPYFSYYEFEEIKDIEASVYDAEGKLVRHLKKKDIDDVKPLDYFVNDFRYKVLRLPGRSYPYTISYTVVKKYTGMMFYPRFQPQASPSISVESASFEMSIPAGLEVRFKEVNLPPDSKIGPNKWEFRHLAAFRPEPYSTKKELQLPKILAAPTDFKFGELDGDMRTWESFGKYLYRLNATQTELAPALKQKLQSMVEDCPDDYCKIQRIYEYLQSNTRYYYVGLGIGGWQPATAAKVDQLKYGDCKGLSNYTASMLNAVGVPAWYSIIRAGSDEQATQFPDFPNAWFNHAIVCVPMENDTLWLECTNQTESCGFLGDFTDNRLALVMTPTGGRLLRTPKYDETKNITSRSTQLKMESDGSATLRTHGVFSGISQNLPAQLEDLSEEKQKEYLYKRLDLKNFKIESLSFKRNKARLPSVEQNMVLSLPNFTTVNGKRLFLPVNLFADKLEIPTSGVSRQTDFQPDARGYTEVDSITISIPPGYVLEGKFEPVFISTAFGTFENTVVEEGSSLTVYRKLVVNSEKRSHEDFPAFVAFLKAVSKADKSKLVLVKSEVRP